MGLSWHISRDIDAALVLAALEKALQGRSPEPGWIHHCDRGVQYACRGYVERLTAAGAQISMSRKGCPRDNAQAESFFRTLKVEEVYLQEYDSFAQASACISQFTLGTCTTRSGCIRRWATCRPPNTSSR